MTPTRRWLLIGILAAIVCSGLRIAGIFDDFWFDEIWSLQLATRAHTIADLLLDPALRVDNNHPLNTLFLFLLQAHQAHWWIFRIPSALAGIAGIAVAASIAARKSPGAAVLTIVLIGCSYPLVHYSSEARGYSLCILFALLAFGLADRFMARAGWGAAALFFLACAFGWLSHVTFTHVYFGLLCWTALRFIHLEPTPKALVRLLQLHLLPLLFAGWYGWVFIRHLVIGTYAGAFAHDLVRGVGDLIYYEAPGMLAMVLSACVFLLLIAITVALYRRRDDCWIFLIASFVVSPAILIAWQAARQQIPPIVSRYLLVNWPFLLMITAGVLQKRLQRPGSGRVALIACIAAFLAVNLWQTACFLSIGRGRYSEAVQYMMDQTPAHSVTVMVDHPARTHLTLQFHSDQLSGRRGQLLAIFDLDPPHPSTQWIVTHGSSDESPPPYCADANNASYALVRRFPAYGFSGFTLNLYRRIN